MKRLEKLFIKQNLCIGHIMILFSELFNEFGNLGFSLSTTWCIYRSSACSTKQSILQPTARKTSTTPHLLEHAGFGIILREKPLKVDNRGHIQEFYSRRGTKGFFSRISEKLLKMRQEFVHIHFCYVFTDPPNILGGVRFPYRYMNKALWAIRKFCL